ncbi:LOW QUALITY PROTEIN: leucine-rich repeat and IQ domain-containing protein 4 [Amazona ochrocephala]
MAESQQSQEASAGGSHCPKADSVGFEDDTQEIPVNKAPENEALSPTRVTQRIFFIDLSNKIYRNKLTITVLPGVLSLEHLEEPHTGKNLIVSIPRDINCLRHMKVLYLDQNHIQECKELGEMKSPLSLDLSNNPLSVVCSKLQSLCQRRLYKNLHEIPVQICGYLYHIELLGLSDSHLQCLPKDKVNLKKKKRKEKIKEIYLQKNRFESFPKELCHIANSEMRDLKQNIISVIPEEGGFLTNLVKPLLAFNNLPSIPPTLQHCQKLAVLNLSHNLLHKLLPGLKNLTEMRPQTANSLEKFPHQICCWSSLSRLYVSDNSLDDIPKGICTMKNLEVLALDDNQIQKLSGPLF